jgi:hypothetical protein
MTYKVTSTTHYAQFKKLNGQRDVIEKRITSLILSIKEKNKLYLFPIIVNKNFEVIDGQHRLEAARRLKIPIYYLIDDEGNERDTLIIHSNRYNWQLHDYVNYFAKIGNQDYITINELWELYRSRVGAFSIFLCIIQMFCLKNKRSSEKLRTGTLVLSNIDKMKSFLDETLDKILEISKLIRRFNKKSSPRVLLRESYLLGLYYCYNKMSIKEYRDLLDFLKRDYTTLAIVNNTSDVYKIIENSYNHGKKTQRLEFMGTIFPSDKNKFNDSQ